MITSLAILTTAIVLFGTAILVSRALARSRMSLPMPCYRCADIATTDYMGLRYCLMCQIVVVRMLPAVRHDPPYGFPGASGYLEFPQQQVEEKKKEG